MWWHCLVACSIIGEAFAVIDGKRVAEGEFPYAVYIENLQDSDYCGGILTSLTKIISNAHCLKNIDSSGTFIKDGKPSKIEVTAGTPVIATSSIGPNFQRKHLSSIVYHPDFKILSPLLFAEDICVAELDTPLHGSDTVKPMNFIAKDRATFQNSWDAIVKDEKLCTSMGWGETKMIDGMPKEPSDVLMKIELKPMTKKKCDTDYKGKKRSGSVGEVCLLPVVKGQEMCFHDSGSPLICDGKVYGIIAIGRDKLCNSAEQPVYALMLAEYLDKFNMDGAPVHSSKCAIIFIFTVQTFLWLRQPI